MEGSFEEMMTEAEVIMMNPLQLAYLGDTVWELMIRKYFIRKHLNVHHLHESTVRYVNAASQSGFVAKISSELNDKERAIVKRGQNAHARHRAPKNQNQSDYALSTGFEALFGYLFLTKQTSRIRYFRDIIMEETENG